MDVRSDRTLVESFTPGRPPLGRDFALETHFARWEFAARYNLAASDMETLTLRELLALAEPGDRDAFENLPLGYTETYGAPELRRVIADTYERVDADRVLCFSGAEEALYVAMRTLLRADDHAVVVTPCYQSAETVPASICQVSGVPLEADRGWALDPDRVARALRPNTRLLYVNFPHNPTGRIVEREIFEAVLDLCRARGVWLLSDEVYRLMERGPGSRLPQAVDAYQRGISLNVMSKAYGLAGLRLGWVACQDRRVLERMERYKHFLTICNAAPSERLAVIALRAGERILARNRALVDANLTLASAFFGEFPELFQWQVPDGGCIGYPRYLGGEGVERFAVALLREAGILVLPASLFHSALGPTPDDRFRIGFGRKDFAEGLTALRKWLVSHGR